MEQAATLRQIKIKTGTLKRNTKDYVSYDKEHAQLVMKVEKMKAEEACPSNIK